MINRMFRTRREVERYFGEKKITCLLCERPFLRLSFHLAAKHSITTDEYKSRFGLPWSRGLTSAQSHANSGWDKRRRLEASKLARKTQFFKLGIGAPRRPAPFFVHAETATNFQVNSSGYGREFEATIRALFKFGLTDAAIARALNVARMTVNRRTKQWRNKNEHGATGVSGRSGRKTAQSLAQRGVP